TKLKRAGFIAAATALVLADLRTPVQADAVLDVVRAHALRRAGDLLALRATLPPGEAAVLTSEHWRRERVLVDSLARFAAPSESARLFATKFLSNLEGATLGAPAAKPPVPTGVVYRRAAEPKG